MAQCCGGCTKAYESAILKGKCIASWQTGLFSGNICKEVKEVTYFLVSQGEFDQVYGTRGLCFQHMPKQKAQGES